MSSRAVAIGIFDGLHLGHQAILRTARVHDDVVALTFHPHPTSVFAPERTPTELVSLRERIELLERYGADMVEVIEFTPDFAALSPDQFIEQVLVGLLKATHVVVGENFTFGHKAAGNVHYLEKVGAKYGFGVSSVALAEDRGSPISSTRIRALIKDGEVERASELLTRNFCLVGAVVHGEKRGRTIGYPTANLGLGQHATIPADGIYAGWLSVGMQRWPAAISIGTNPTFEGVRGRQVEAYALDQTDLDLYEQEARIEFGWRLRDTVKFDSLPALLDQMKLDCDRTRELTREVLS